MKSGWEVDITTILSLLCPYNTALIWLPFSCYLVAGRMAKVEAESLSEKVMLYLLVV